MKRWAWLLVFFLLFASVGYSQGYIDLSQRAIKRNLKKYTKKEKLNSTLEETESTITFSVKDSSVRPFAIALHFDDKGKCNQEFRTFDCDSCAQQYLAKALSYKSYKWKKISSNQYLSKYALHRSLLINPPTKEGNSFTIKRFDLKKKDYKLLINNAK